jgi:putative hemolysin
MMMWLLGRLPHTGDKAQWERWQLEVVDLDGKRVDKVLASPLAEPDETGKDAGSPPRQPE